MTDRRPPLLDRVQHALTVLRGSSSATTSAAVEGNTTTRASVDLIYPSLSAGQGGIVRSANPQEYKPDGATVRMQGFSRHPVVHACIRVIADIVASVPLVVLTEKGNRESRVPDTHPLQRLLDYPGPRLTARGMRARYAVDFIGYGNAFFQLDRPGPNRPPVSIRSINAESIQAVWVDNDGDARRYDYGNWSGLIQQVPVEDVLHFRDLDMPRPFAPDVFGFPRGATAIASMTADNEATQYVRQVVTNDGTPTFAVLLSDQASQDDALAMQDRYRARVVDRGKRGTPAFFGAVRDIKPLGFTLSDLEFPSLRKVSREDICAAYGVDPRMIGIASATSDSGLSGAQYAEARQRLVQHTIEPMLSAIEDELNNWLAPEFGDVWIMYDADTLRDLVENDTETSTRVQAEFKASLRTWEESRRALKLPPVPEPTDTLAMTTGTQLVPAAVAVIDPRAIADQAPALGDQVPPSGLGPDVTEAQDDADATLDNAAGLAQGRAELTNFPAKGDNKAVSLRTSQWKLFPVDEAAALKADYPEIWRKGGNIRGNAQFIALEPIARGGGKPDGVAEENAVRLREAWGARHRGDFQLAGVVAQVKWLVVGDQGLPAMRKVLREAKAALKDRQAPRVDIRALAEESLSGDQIEAMLELLEAVVEQELPAAAVEAIMLAAFPTVDAELIAQMVQSAAAFVAPPEEPEAPLAGDVPVEAAKLMWYERMTPEELAVEPRFMQWRAAMDVLTQREGGFYDEAAAEFAAERQSVGALFGVGTRARKTNAQILDEIARRIAADYKPGGEYYMAWRARFLKLIGDMYMVGARQAGGVGLSFTLDSPEVLAAITKRSSTLAGLVGETTSTQILSAIRAGELGGFSVAEIGRLVQASVFNETVTDARARTIARTESAGAMSQGNWDQAQAMGDLYQSKEWLAFEDSKTRETHTACMAQGRIPFTDRFSNGLDYPLDPAGSAAEVINCRCVLAYYDTTVEEQPR